MIRRLRAAIIIKILRSLGFYNLVFTSIAHWLKERPGSQEYGFQTVSK